ncbi:MAG: hypothetical protein QOF92_978 [Pseudonocardiales bacterium]|nr:hypothetical protein [Pseudonocardiales bacterium]
MLSARMPELSALEVLVTVARTGSLNVAARELGRTQQAVSARIASMEAQTGVVLVTRTPRGSVLTPVGVVVADWAARLLDTAGELDAGLAALRHKRRVKVTVAASLTVAERLLPGWLVTLRSNAGNVSTGITLAAVNSTEVAEQVLGGSADVGFVEGPSAPRGCRSRVIGHDVLRLVVRPDHPWATRRTAVPARQLAATGLVTRERGSGTREALETALRRSLGIDTQFAPAALELSTTAAIRTAVLAGAGPAVLSDLVVADDVAAGRLRAVPVADVDLGRALRAIWTGGRTPPAGLVRNLVAIAAARAEAPQR